MILKDILQKYSFDIILTDLCEIMPVLDRKRSALREAYDFLMSQTPVFSKKRIIYQLIDSPDSDDCFIGAEDRCFEAQWNVILGKEVVVADDVDITELEIASNSFFCILLLGFSPRRFSSLRDELLSEM